MEGWQSAKAVGGSKLASKDCESEESMFHMSTLIKSYVAEVHSSNAMKKAA